MLCSSTMCDILVRSMPTMQDNWMIRTGEFCRNTKAVAAYLKTVPFQPILFNVSIRSKSSIMTIMPEITEDIIAVSTAVCFTSNLRKVNYIYVLIKDRMTSQLREVRHGMYALSLQNWDSFQWWKSRLKAMYGKIIDKALTKVRRSLLCYPVFPPPISSVFESYFSTVYLGP
jgi:hypothetical protein